MTRLRPATRISASNSCWRPPVVTSARMIASEAPERTSIASPTPRNDRVRAIQPIASSKLVLPWPLAPCNTVNPDASSTSTSCRQRKSVNHRCPTLVAGPASAVTSTTIAEPSSGRAHGHEQIQEVAATRRAQRRGLERIDGVEDDLVGVDRLHSLSQEHRVERNRQLGPFELRVER